MPLRLSHEAITKSPILKSAYKVSVAMTSTCSASTTPRVCSRLSISIWWWWIVCRTRLQPDWGIRIEMTSHSLYGRRNTPLLWVKRGCSLPASSCRCLCVKTLRRRVLWLHLSLHHAHLMSISWRLSRVRWRCALLMSRVHTVVNRRCLIMRWLMILSHLHSISRLGGRLSLSLSCLRCLRGSLFACSFCLLLLLYAGGNALVECRELQIHWRYKRTSEFLLRDEGMQLSLLGRPSLQWIDL